MSASPVRRLSRDETSDAVRVLCDAFSDYPVMRSILGMTEPDSFARRLHALVEFFVMARALRDEPILAIESDGQVVAAATLTPPESSPTPAALSDVRSRLWADLGVDALDRYEAFGRVWDQFEIDQPHYHLNMIGVVGEHRGRGLGRRLLDAVHDLSSADPKSTGVSLTTEDPANVPLYEHVGYRVVGHGYVSPDVETWGLFRPN